MTKPAELRELVPADLAQRLEEGEQELFNLRFQLATGRLENVSRIGMVRKEVARIRTLQGEQAAKVDGRQSRGSRRASKEA